MVAIPRGECKRRRRKTRAMSFTRAFMTTLIGFLWLSVCSFAGAFLLAGHRSFAKAQVSIES